MQKRARMHAGWRHHAEEPHKHTSSIKAIFTLNEKLGDPEAATAAAASRCAPKGGAARSARAAHETSRAGGGVGRRRERREQRHRPAARDRVGRAWQLRQGRRHQCDAVRIAGPVTLFHHPKNKQGLEVQGMTGKVVRIATQAAFDDSVQISANYRLIVQFDDMGLKGHFEPEELERA